MTWDEEEVAGLMADAVAFGAKHVEAGGLPFVGLLLADDGYVSDPGVNLVQETGDPSAHAEIVAMRATLRDLGRADLAGSWLLATGEPCGLCYRSALDHRVERVFVAVDADTAAAWGFDYRPSYRALGIDRARLTGFVRRLPVPDGLLPFRRHLELRRAGGGPASITPPDTKGTS
ncbi:tRNA(Arg) A34 adenosine deaminase TadA [Actinomadura hallensis]|uniref:tRNA(Arg) A34 adenosine deaminase TadA n=1 Tax=Actinomadura hallensis TaxID=337895 RepID=A0A543IN85_9ACTN|nr:nucleoside deaminase [Actinomadura hallensis]TQM72053.1 tRNA(Arg) A34 adenosine deaminase TadA [Actinomadura hallensis]